MLQSPSAILAALDSVDLDDDELDIIRQEIEDDPEADMEEEDPSDEQDSLETPSLTLSRERSRTSDHECGTGCSITQDEGSPPPAVIPAKRKRVSKKQRERDAGKFQVMGQLSRKSYSCVLGLPEPPKKINYILSIVSNSGAKKNASKRVSIGRILELDASEPWDTVKAQIFMMIGKSLAPATIRFQDYDVSFTIARAVTQPLPLISESDYLFLVKQSTKGRCEDPVYSKRVTCTLNNFL